jgi:hypothetical protein
VIEDSRAHARLLQEALGSAFPSVRIHRAATLAEGRLDAAADEFIAGRRSCFIRPCEHVGAGWSRDDPQPHPGPANL